MAGRRLDCTAPQTSPQTPLFFVALERLSSPCKPYRRGAKMTNTTQQLPSEGFLRLDQILGNPKADPPIAAIIPVSKSTWYAGQKEGRFPTPVTFLGARTRAYRVEDIRSLIDNGTFVDHRIKQSWHKSEDIASLLTKTTVEQHAASIVGEEEVQPSEVSHGSKLASHETTPICTGGEFDKVENAAPPAVSRSLPHLWVVEGFGCAKLSVISLATAIELARGKNLLGRKFNCQPKTVTFASDTISTRRLKELLDRLHPTTKTKLEEDTELPGLVLLPRERLHGSLLLDPSNSTRDQFPETTEILIVDTKNGDKSSEAIDLKMFENFVLIVQRQLPRLKLVVIISRVKIATCRSNTFAASVRSRYLTLQCLNEIGALRYRLSIDAVEHSAGAKPAQFELICQKDCQSQHWNWSRTRL